MKRVEREQLAVVTAILEPLGIPHELRRGKHLVVEITGPGGSQHSIPLSGSPRSGLKEQQNFARQKTVALLRSFGITVGPEKHHHEGPRRRRNGDRLVLRFEAREPCRLDQDPWAKLEALR